jgi:hypothetical protein
MKSSHEDREESPLPVLSALPDRRRLSLSQELESVKKLVKLRMLLLAIDDDDRRDMPVL